MITLLPSKNTRVRKSVDKDIVKTIPKSFKSTPQYSCLHNPMDIRAWWAVVHGVAKSRTRLSDFTFTFHFHALEKGVLAWRIPGMGEPGGLLSMGSHRVGHHWSDLAAAAVSVSSSKLGWFLCYLWVSLRTPPYIVCFSALLVLINYYTGALLMWW